MKSDPDLNPPEDSVWVSLDHLKKFKKLALAQMKAEGRLSSGGNEEPAGLN